MSTNKSVCKEFRQWPLQPEHALQHDDARPRQLRVREALRGDPNLRAGWFAAAGVHTRVATVARFNGLSLMLQAAEQGLGCALTEDVLAADALCAGRLVRRFDVAFEDARATSHQLVVPAAPRDWLAVHALRAWLRAEFEASFDALHASRETAEGKGTAPRFP